MPVLHSAEECSKESLAVRTYEGGGKMPEGIFISFFPEVGRTHHRADLPEIHGSQAGDEGAELPSLSTLHVGSEIIEA